MNIKIIIGTKAELIKMFPLIHELKRKSKDFEIIATGQHDLTKLVHKLNINDEIYYINDPREGFMLSSKDAISFAYKSIPKLKKILSRKDLVIVHGDTISTVIGALSGRLVNAKVSHIEAGLRSWDFKEPFPEEINRNLADFLSNILIAVSKLSYRNLLLQFPWKRDIYLVGNTIIDSAKIAINYSKINPPKEDYGIVSIHRHENLKNKLRMIKIINILLKISEKIKLYFFMHKNTEKALKLYNLYEYLKRSERIIIREPLEYPDFIRFLSSSKLLLTDGGSIQEESLIFNVPCIILRMKTERIEGVFTGLNYLSRLNIKETVKKAEEFLSGNYPRNVKNPYGESGVSKRIVSILMEYVEDKN